jgi:excisionase family DNA binding protein
MTPGLSTDDVMVLPAMVDLPTAARALGIGRSKAYELVQSGDFPCRVVRIGRAYRVPTIDIRRLLGL